MATIPLAPCYGDNTAYTKIFVGGLAWQTQTKTLRRHFEQFGEILEAVVITDKHNGRSKGYGFVTFIDPDAAKRACADATPIIDGRRTNCNLASLGANRSRIAGGNHPSCMQPPIPPFPGLVGGIPAGFQTYRPSIYTAPVIYHPPLMQFSPPYFHGVVQGYPAVQFPAMANPAFFPQQFASSARVPAPAVAAPKCLADPIASSQPEVFAAPATSSSVQQQVAGFSDQRLAAGGLTA